MKIAYIVAALSNKGVISLVRDLSNRLIEIGHQCDIYYFDETIELNFNAPTKRIGFFEKIDFDKYDVIHSHSLRPNIYVFLHRKSYHKAKYVTTMHSYIKEDLYHTYNALISFVFTKIWNYVLTRQDLIITLTNDAKIYYSKFLLNKKLEYAYSGRDIPHNISEINKKDLQLLNNIRTKYKIIGTNCVITTIKGLDQIIRLLRRNTDYAFVIVGEGKEKNNLLKLAKDLNVADRCFFLGYRSNAIAYLKYYDVYILPSRSEGFPLALFEAIANKKPLILSGIPIFKELFEGINYISFELDNIESLNKALKKLLNQELIFQITLQLYQKYKNDYTAAAMALRYLKIYNKISEVKVNE